MDGPFVATKSAASAAKPKSRTCKWDWIALAEREPPGYLIPWPIGSRRYSLPRLQQSDKLPTPIYPANLEARCLTLWPRSHNLEFGGRSIRSDPHGFDYKLKGSEALKVRCTGEQKVRKEGAHMQFNLD